MHRTIARAARALVPVCATLAPCSTTLATGLTSLVQAVPSEEEPLLAALEWRELGPATFGGRIVDIALLPGERHGFLVAAATGGLWRTANGGTTFEPVFEGQPGFSIGAIAVDPTNAQVIWVGSGEANNQRSSYWGDGVYKTTDGGKSWRNVGLTGSHHIGRIAIDPRDPDVVYVAALGHLYTSNPERGLYRTSDGGETWERALFVDEVTGVVDVLIDPLDPDTVYAASYERLRRAWHFDGAGPGSGIWRSKDAGASWERLGGGLPEGDLGRIGLCAFQGERTALFACVSNQNALPPEPAEPRELLGAWGAFEERGLRLGSVAEDGPAAEAGLAEGDLVTGIAGVAPKDLWSVLRALAKVERGERIELTWERDGEERRAELELAPGREREVGGEIYRSDDGGGTWRRLNEEPVSGDPPYYYGQIRVDPKDPERLYLLGVPLYVSDDGGKTWARRNLAGSVHVDHHALVIDPEDPERLLLGNDGGLAISRDRGETWDHQDNLPLAQFYAVGLDQRRPYHVYGGTQDNGTWGGPSRSRDARGIDSSEWYRVGGGDGFYAQIDPRDPDTVYAESQFGALFRRDLATGRTSFIRPPRDEPEGEPDRFNWNSPILISHHNPEILYFGGNRLFKSFDRGDHWPVISGDLTTANAERIEGNVPHCTITTISESPFDPNLLLVGTDDGLVQRSEDGGLSWTNLAGRFPDLPGGWWVSRVVLSRHAEDRCYATFTGYREDDFRPLVYASDDRGQSWRPLHEGLPASPLNVLQEDPANADVLYVGSEHGAHVSLDRGASWLPLGKGLPTNAVHDLAVHARDRELVVATHGRGFWAVDVAPFAELSAATLAERAHLYPVTDHVLLASQRTGARSGDRWHRGANPPDGAAVWYSLAGEEAKGAGRLTILDVAGQQVAELELDLTPGLHVARWDLRVRSARDAETGAEDEAPRGRRRPRTRRAEPGRYRAVLTIGEERLERSFELLADPLIAASEIEGPDPFR